LVITFAVDLSLPLAERGGVDPLVAVDAGEAALVPGLAGSSHQLGQVNALVTSEIKSIIWKKFCFEKFGHWRALVTVSD
jgi:hypothetical protein